MQLSNGAGCELASRSRGDQHKTPCRASVAQVAREDITQKSTKTIPLRLERAVTQYGDFQFA